MLEWLGMYRTVEETHLGIPKYHWNKPASGRCDWPFAYAYMRIGMDRFIEQYVTFAGGEGYGDFAQRGLDIHPSNTAYFNPLSPS